MIRNVAVTVTPYVLPHPSKVSAEEYRKYEGKDGYLENAGFYIYRNKRLISKGTWYRMIRRSNLSKLLDAIEQLKTVTQLIVISHQRRTMEQADVLYGVSMQADGVSHVVSQRLDKVTGKVVES